MMFKTQVARFALITISLCLISSASNAATITETDRGWYTNGGFHGAANTNYSILNFGTMDRAFFVFDLSALAGTVTAATFELNAWELQGNSTEVFYDFSSDVTNLIAGTGGVSAWTDLGSGNSYGSQSWIDPTDEYSVMSITLNAQAIADINASAGGFFVIGSTLTSGTLAHGASHEVPFPSNALVLTVVPEPSTAMLVALGTVILGITRRGRVAA